MLYDSKRVHPLFNVCIKKSAELGQNVLFFLTSTGVSIELSVFPEESIPVIVIKKENDVPCIMESYLFYAHGTCIIQLHITTGGVTGKMFSFSIRSRYEKEQVLAEERWPCKQLDSIVRLLEDEGTRYIKPYLFSFSAKK